MIDTNNYYPQRDGQIAELDDESTTVSELLQAHLPQSHVVKAFNNIHFTTLEKLARPSGDPERTTLPIAGDDDVGEEDRDRSLLDDLGYDTLDAGPLSEGWRYQRDTAAYGLYAGPGRHGRGPPSRCRRGARRARQGDALPRHVSRGRPDARPTAARNRAAVARPGSVRSRLRPERQQEGNSRVRDQGDRRRRRRACRARGHDGHQGLGAVRRDART